MSKYRKLLVAVVGLVVLFLTEYAGIRGMLGMEENIVTMIVSALTAAGVWVAPNEASS